MGGYAGDGGEDYWRYNLFLMPFYSMPPGQPSQKLRHAFVPLDDRDERPLEHHLVARAPAGTPATVAAMRRGSGVHAELIPGTHIPLAQ